MGARTRSLLAWGNCNISVCRPWKKRVVLVEYAELLFGIKDQVRVLGDGLVCVTCNCIFPGNSLYGPAKIGGITVRGDVLEILFIYSVACTACNSICLYLILIFGQ